MADDEESAATDVAPTTEKEESGGEAKVEEGESKQAEATTNGNVENEDTVAKPAESDKGSDEQKTEPGPNDADEKAKEETTEAAEAPGDTKKDTDGSEKKDVDAEASTKNETEGKSTEEIPEANGGTEETKKDSKEQTDSEDKKEDEEKAAPTEEKESETAKGPEKSEDDAKEPEEEKASADGEDEAKDEKKADDVKATPKKEKEEGAKEDIEMEDADAKDKAEEKPKEKEEEEKDSKEDEEMEDGSEHESPIPSKSQTTPVSGRRPRKSTALYDGGNFKEDREKTQISINPGRGLKLRDIPVVKANIDKMNIKDPVLTAAYKLLFYGNGEGRRGAIGKKVLKKHILDFSGYLPPRESGQKNAEEDDELESKFGAKAFRLNLPLIKSFCDLFCIPRKVNLDKESMINLLLDFLSAPDSKLTAAEKTPKKRGRGRPPGSGKKSVSPAPKKARKSRKSVEKKEEEVESEDDEEVTEEIDGKKVPTKKEFRKFVRAYITCFSMDKTTTKHLIQTASDKFDMDLTPKKADILEILTAEMPSE